MMCMGTGVNGVTGPGFARETCEQGFAMAMAILKVLSLQTLGASLPSPSLRPNPRCCYFPISLLASHPFPSAHRRASSLLPARSSSRPGSSRIASPHPLRRLVLMAARMAAVGAALCVTLLLLLPAVAAFYLPGVAPLDLDQVRAFPFAIRFRASLAVFCDFSSTVAWGTRFFFAWLVFRRPTFLAVSLVISFSRCLSMLKGRFQLVRFAVVPVESGQVVAGQR